MKALTLALCLLVGTTIAVSSYAQSFPKRKPGLWEMQIKSSGNNDGTADFHEKLARLPPEERAKVEKTSVVSQR